MTVPGDPLALLMRAVQGDPVSRALTPPAQPADQPIRRGPSPTPQPELRAQPGLAEQLDLVMRLLSTPYDVARTIPGAVRDIKAGDFGRALGSLGWAALPGPNPKTVKGVPAHLDDLLRMNHTEVEAAVDAIRQHERGAAAAVFGEAVGKDYERAQRLVNSSTAHLTKPDAVKQAENLIADLEGRLTPQQQQRLFGTGTTTPSFEEVRELGRSASHYAPATLKEQKDEEVLRHFVALAGGDRDPTDALVRYGLPRLYQELARRGLTDEQLVHATLKRLTQRGIDAATAGEYLAQRMQVWQSLGKAP